MQEWMRWKPTRDRRRFGSLLLTPARIGVGIGALATLVAGFMPWAEGTVPGRGGFGPAFFSGLGGSGDGVVLVLLAGATWFLVLHRTPAESRVRLVHALPLVLILLAAVTSVNGYRSALLEIAAWERRGGTGALAPGMYLSFAGVAVMAAAAVALLPRLLRWTTEHDDPGDLMRATPRGVAEVVLGTLGILVGGGLGVVGTVGMFAVPVIGLVALGAVFGALLGAYAGSWLAGFAADVVERRGQASPDRGRTGR